MARKLSAALKANTAKQFTQPVYLIAQDMGANVLRNSTRELVDYLGNDYVPSGGAAVDSISNDRVTWSLDNSDRAISILALGNDVGGNSVTVYMHYEGETVVRFTGVLDEWKTSGQRVAFTATSQAAKAQKFPNERAEIGVFNHLPAPGTSIEWGQQTIILNAEPI